MPEIKKNKPYGFVPLPETMTTAAPIWHDGAKSKALVSGEVTVHGPCAFGLIL